METFEAKIQLYNYRFKREPQDLPVKECTIELHPAQGLYSLLTGKSERIPCAGSFFLSRSFFLLFRNVNAQYIAGNASYPMAGMRLDRADASKEKNHFIDFTQNKIRKTLNLCGPGTQMLRY
jgi:hypothetical protein